MTELITKIAEMIIKCTYFKIKISVTAVQKSKNYISLENTMVNIPISHIKK